MDTSHRRARLGALSAASALLLIAGCVAVAFATPGSPLHPKLTQQAHTTGTHVQATSTHTKTSVPAVGSTPVVHPTATTKKSNGTGGGGGGVVYAPTTAPKPTIKPATATPIPPAPTATFTPTPIPRYYETPGSAGSPTFTDYHNAGGTTGQRVGAYQTVRVSCRVQGWKSATAPAGDDWWYRIQDGPWNNAFYAYADNFYNNGQTSGPLNNGVLFDASVPLC